VPPAPAITGGRPSNITGIRTVEESYRPWRSATAWGMSSLRPPPTSQGPSVVYHAVAAAPVFHECATARAAASSSNGTLGVGRQRERGYRVLLGPQSQYGPAGGQDHHAGTTGQQLVEVAANLGHIFTEWHG
jgi:hypothetical protein